VHNTIEIVTGSVDGLITLELEEAEALRDTLDHSISNAYTIYGPTCVGVKQLIDLNKLKVSVQAKVKSKK